MPVPPLFGAFGVAGSGNHVTFVAEHHYAPSFSQLVSFTGATVGDLGIVIISNSLTSFTAVPSGWTLASSYVWASNPYNDYTLYKVLTSGDISSGVTFATLAADGLLAAVVYRGATVATVVGTGDTTTSATTIPGFTKNAGCVGIVTYSTTRQTAATLVSPAVTASRIANYTGGAHFKFSVDDIIYPWNYTNGAGLTYTGGSTETIARAIELT